MKKIELIHEPKTGKELIKLLKKRIERLEKENTYLKSQSTIHSVVLKKGALCSEMCCGKEAVSVVGVDYWYRCENH